MSTYKYDDDIINSVFSLITVEDKMKRDIFWSWKRHLLTDDLLLKRNWISCKYPFDVRCRIPFTIVPFGTIFDHIFAFRYLRCVTLRDQSAFEIEFIFWSVQVFIRKCIRMDYDRDVLFFYCSWKLFELSLISIIDVIVPDMTFHISALVLFELTIFLLDWITLKVEISKNLWKGESDNIDSVIVLRLLRRFRNRPFGKKIKEENHKYHYIIFISSRYRKEIVR